MKLYDFKPFPNPRRVRMFLAEKQIAVENHQIDVMAGEHRSAAFRAKNPACSLPTLELDDGTFISESIAICRYIEEVQPEPVLMGHTPRGKAITEMWQRRVEQSLMDPVLSFFHHATPGLGTLEPFQIAEWGEKNKDRAIAGMQLIDDQLADNRYIAGDAFSVADITGLCAVDVAAQLDIPIPEDCANVKRWYEDVSSRPSAAA